MDGSLIGSFTDVNGPRHLSIVDDVMLVADYFQHRVLLLDTQLHVQRVLVDNSSDVMELCQPTRLCYNQLTSQLYVAHRSSSRQSSSWSWPDIISLLSLR